MAIDELKAKSTEEEEEEESSMNSAMSHPPLLGQRSELYGLHDDGEEQEI